jgi:hypothetical protein
MPSFNLAGGRKCIGIQPVAGLLTVAWGGKFEYIACITEHAGNGTDDRDSHVVTPVIGGLKGSMQCHLGEIT